jgi:alpha-glutamyl/putrescinyl thymine pyrophosphorylase clade 1
MNAEATLPASLQALEPTIVFKTYWTFVTERYALYRKRLAGSPPPWTEFTPFHSYKFTNVWRATDRVSQKCISIANAPGRDLRNDFFRTLLFKFFNKIETWDLLTSALGEEPSLKNYDFSRYDRILTEAKGRGVKLYSNAYMMPCPAIYGKNGIVLKHQMHLDIIEEMMKSDVPGQMLAVGSLEGAYKILKRVRMLGGFMAYQFTIDFNYGPHLLYPEESFVVAGPGAREGVAKCFAAKKKPHPEEIINLIYREQDAAALYYTGAPAPTLFGRRKLMPIDLQNCFCETGKLARVLHPEFNTGRTRIKTRYDTGLARPLPAPEFPAAWNFASVSTAAA